VLALVPWGDRGLYEAPAIEHKACPPTMGAEPPRALKHPAVIGLDGLRVFLTPPEGGLDLVTNRQGVFTSSYQVSRVKAFPRNLRSGLPLRRIGRSGDSRPTPNQNLLMPDG